jgi:aldose 1-epimerase
MATETMTKEEIYGNLPDGRAVKIFTLTNANGLRARVMEYGAILVSLETPDRQGVLADLTHGHDALVNWLVNPYYLGASVGRFGNRIKDGTFSLEGVDYTLATTNHPGGRACALHGGLQGFDQKLWSGKITAKGTVEFSYCSADGEEGYPGNLTAKITYSLNDSDELIWTAEAHTDAPTVINLIHHSYWNLTGDPTQPITDHILTLPAEAYLPTDAGLIPTGEIATVADTPMDFRTPTVIGLRIDEEFEALKLGGGYDHAWVLGNEGAVTLAARLEDPKSGRVMEVFTDQPAVQLYTGNGFDGSMAGKNWVRYQARTALCLETEGFPDAPNQPSFPSSVLRPGEIYQHTMIHRFSVSE